MTSASLSFALVAASPCKSCPMSGSRRSCRMSALDSSRFVVMTHSSKGQVSIP